MASPLIVTPARSTISRAASMLGPWLFHELSAEKSITCRQPSNPFSSISSSPRISAAPMAFEPRARRGGSRIRAPKSRALAASSITIQSTTTSWLAAAAHST